MPHTAKRSRSRHPIVRASSEAYNEYRKLTSRAKIGDADLKKLADSKAKLDRIWSDEVEKLKAGAAGRYVNSRYNEWEKLFGAAKAKEMRKLAEGQ